MLCRFNRKSKAQSTAEYAILLGLVIAAAAAMQIYMKRGIQARVHTMSRFLVDQTNALDNGQGVVEYQYEPYYINSSTTVERGGNSTGTLEREGNYLKDEQSLTNRDGYQAYQYSNADDQYR